MGRWQMKTLRNIPIDNLDQTQRRPALALRLRLVIGHIELAVLQNTEHLVFPLLAMFDILRDARIGGLHYSAMAWIPTALDTVEHAVETDEVGLEIFEDGGAVAENIYIIISI